MHRLVLLVTIGSFLIACKGVTPIRNSEAARQITNTILTSIR